MSIETTRVMTDLCHHLQISCGNSDAFCPWCFCYHFITIRKKTLQEGIFVRLSLPRKVLTGIRVECSL
jgi:hypothetical protein